MNPAVQGYCAAVLDTTPEAEREKVAADLASLDRLLGRSPELRAALTDVAVPPRARRAVVDDLFAGKVDDRSRRLAAFSAGAVHAQDVPAAITWVANEARHRAEGRTDTDEALGHQASRRRVGGYADCVYEDVEVAQLDEIEDELFRFARTVASTPALRSALTDRDLPPEVRRGVVDDLLSSKVRPETLRLVEYAITAGRVRDVVGTLDWLVERTAEARGWRVAKVRAGQDVDSDERAKLEATLSRLAGSPVELQVTVEPSLLAGVNVEIGDLQLDGTARGRLERLREHVTASAWGTSGTAGAAAVGGATRNETDGAATGRPEGAH